MEIVSCSPFLIQPLIMYVNSNEGKIEINITDDHDRVEQKGKTAKDICDDPNCNRITCNTFYPLKTVHFRLDLQVKLGLSLRKWPNFII